LFHPFNIQPSEIGSEPRAALALAADGNFYGTTTDQSGNGAGVIFRLSPQNVITRLAYNGPAGPNGISYTQFTQATDGTLYAAIYDIPTIPPSQPQFPINVIVRLRTNGSLLFRAGLNRAMTGAEVVAPLTEGIDHNFYGVASEGGAGNAGTIFKVTPAGSLSLVHTFHGTDGNKPESALVLAADGNFYGTTSRGGVHDQGTIFRLVPSGVLTTLISFAGTNGSIPHGGLTRGADGNLYGTTNLGGTNNKGTFYRLTLNGILTTLASFSSSTGTVPVNGVTLGFDGNFYGTTRSDGDHLVGTAFRVTPTGVITKLASFGDVDGYRPIHGIIQGTDGNFYGTAGIGGINNTGTVFKAAPDGKVTTLVSYIDPISGSTPIAQGATGALYGATLSGGANDGGIAYKLTLNGTFTKLADLSTTTGTRAVDFLRGQDGNFYGLTQLGGANNGGTIFKLTPAGAITPFAALDLGLGTEERFSEDADGNFYGTADFSIGHNNGIAFKVNSSGVETTLGVFDVNQNAANPVAGITRGADGNFYGAVRTGGPSFNGTLYQLAPGGTITPLTPEIYSGTRLLRMSDGNLYGVGFDVGQFFAGLIFRVTSTGAIESWPAFDQSYINLPTGSLLAAADGYIYGTTQFGGNFDGGVIYRFTSKSPTLTSLSPTTARPRESVALTGHYLAGTTAVSFNGVAAKKFTIDSSTRITVEVPTGANTGSMEVTNPLGTATTSGTFTPLPPIPQLRNISTRGKVLTGDNVLIAGFIIIGSGQEEILMRAMGPSLTKLHVPGALQDPVLELYDHTGALIAVNDNWNDTQQVVIKATNLAPADARESAIFRPLSPGAYTAIMKGRNNITGVGLVEVYDLSHSPGLELANISSRGFVSSGDDVMIAGLIVGETGSGSSRELLRALGPSLSNAHVAGALQNPSLELHNSNGALVAVNDNWATDPHAAQIQNEGFAPSDARESAMLPTLTPGAYTVIVRGVNGATGVGLVEAYNLH
jgi:uncharacterized repeat protein (TIGR03803 family)